MEGIFKVDAISKEPELSEPNLESTTEGEEDDDEDEEEENEEEEDEEEEEEKDELSSLIYKIFFLVSFSDTLAEVRFLMQQIASRVNSMDYESEIRSLITLIYSNLVNPESELESESKFIRLYTRLVFLLKSMDPDSEIRSLIRQIASFINSMDPESEMRTILTKLASMDLEPEIISLFNQITSLGSSREMDSELESDTELDPEPEGQFYISLCPQLEVETVEERYRVKAKIQNPKSNKKRCELNYKKWELFKFTGEEDITYFHCRNCNGTDHEEYEKAPIEVKHPLHPRHYLQLVLLKNEEKARICYCCGRYLRRIFYYCFLCDYAMHVACVEKPTEPVIKHLKMHQEHNLYLFPRQTSLTCNLCALVNSRYPIYICGPCDFVAHQGCLALPRLIKISRHFHRIAFTSSFEQGDFSCGVCRREINNDYGGYCCTKDGCLYAVHSRCATQANVWDGKELENELEESEEEELEPFLRIRDGVIQHFSHEHHHLSLDHENASRVYDENKLCEACIMPIYHGNFYSCIQCEFILHEACANLSRKVSHPIHPHLLTLVGGFVGVINTALSVCFACSRVCTGFFYNCGSEGCRFMLHVQCASILEPLKHESHIHPLFLTSKPGERRTCQVCKDPTHNYLETFNCIECDYSLCFKCATLPHKVRYQHDKHMLTLSYGKETTSNTTYWCDACERKINSTERMYVCDEYCCVTLHTECLEGRFFNIKPGSSLCYYDKQLDVLPNTHVSRPICVSCGKYCHYKNVYKYSGSIICSITCVSQAILLSIV